MSEQRNRITDALMRFFGDGAVGPQFEAPHSTEADPATQNFNNSFRQLFGREAPRAPSTYQFNEDYARSLGMSEEQIRKRMLQ